MIINLNNEELRRISNVLREKRTALENQIKAKSKDEFIASVYDTLLESIETDNKLIAYLESKIEKDY